MKAQVIRSPLHQRRGERLVQCCAERRQILEEDLLLKVLGAGRDKHALATEDGRNQVCERLAGACASFGDERPAVFNDLSNRGGHGPLTLARLVAVNDCRERAGIRESRGDRVR
jgi:hypothetical protein